MYHGCRGPFLFPRRPRHSFFQKDCYSLLQTYTSLRLVLYPTQQMLSTDRLALLYAQVLDCWPFVACRRRHRPPTRSQRLAPCHPPSRTLSGGTGQQRLRSDKVVSEFDAIHRLEADHMTENACGFIDDHRRHASSSWLALRRRGSRTLGTWAVD